MTTPQQTRDRSLGLALTALVVIVFIIFLFYPLKETTAATLSIIRFLAALAAGFSAYLFIGSMDLSGELPLNVSKPQIRATGAFAIFTLVLLLFFLGIPSSEKGAIAKATPQPATIITPPSPSVTTGSITQTITGSGNATSGVSVGGTTTAHAPMIGTPSPPARVKDPH
ncbi:MAG TPA: hypothetical protein VHQ90_03490 [Thermoanaerobaculia bacterium]|nr:hypothetical protein [Thermoanaerobaculia bacterium]